MTNPPSGSLPSPQFASSGSTEDWAPQVETGKPQVNGALVALPYFATKPIIGSSIALAVPASRESATN